MRSIANCLIALTLLILLLAIAHPAHAAGVVGTGTPGSCTEAGLDAALAGGGTVSFNCGSGSHTILLSGQKSINADTIIEGSGLITLSGGNSTRLFDIGAALTLRDIILTNGYFNGDGGVIRNNANGTLTLDNSTIQDSVATLSGGAIVSYGPMTITHSVLTNNSALNGGALYLRFAAAQTTIADSSLHDNQATGAAHPDGYGGAILVWDGAELDMRGTNVTSNMARAGAGLYNEKGDVILYDVTFNNNSAEIEGGGISNWEGSTATLSYVTFSGNSAEIGGGFDNGQSIATLTNVMFSGNSATLYGGGLANVSLATLTNVTFSDNSAKYGGGLMNAGDATLRNITFSGNSANSLGGGIYNQGVVMLTNVTLNGNSAMPGAGGGIHNNGIDTYATLKNTILAGDPASSNCVNVNDASFFSTGFNISDDSSCVTYFTQPSDHSNLYPLLGPLADYGGFTPTHKPQPGSPAIDAGQCLAELPTDQRGVLRPQGAACDIGAVEVEMSTEHELFLPLVVG